MRTLHEQTFRVQKKFRALVNPKMFGGAAYALAMSATRYRCAGCGNLTRFDVVETRRTRSFHHYTVGGELTIESQDIIEATVESVTCHWCSGKGEPVDD